MTSALTLFGLTQAALAAAIAQRAHVVGLDRDSGAVVWIVPMALLAIGWACLRMAGAA